MNSAAVAVAGDASRRIAIGAAFDVVAAILVAQAEKYRSVFVVDDSIDDVAH